MKLKTNLYGGATSGYQLWLSANDTYNWAHKIGASWPCTLLSGRRVFVEVDRNGLVDIAIDGKTPAIEIDSNELNAMIADFTINDPIAKEFWPNWA